MQQRLKFLGLMGLGALVACQSKAQTVPTLEHLEEALEAIWTSEQTPIRSRDSLIDLYGVDHELVQAQQMIYEGNHAENERQVKAILDTYGWPSAENAGERGNWTLCNVIQHAENEVRLAYLPLMRQAVTEGKLEPRFLARAEDRIATERGDLQLYGGQMKYYPETQSFNVWPVYDPANVDARRAAIGLGPIAEHLKQRFDFEWDLEEQIRRSEEFERAKAGQ